MKPLEAPRTFLLKESLRRGQRHLLTEAERAMIAAPVVYVPDGWPEGWPTIDWSLIRLPFPTLVYETVSSELGGPYRADRWYLGVTNLREHIGHADHCLCVTAFMEGSGMGFARYPFAVELYPDERYYAPVPLYQDERCPKDDAKVKSYSDVLLTLVTRCIILANLNEGVPAVVPASQRGATALARKVPHRGWTYRIITIRPTQRTSAVLGGTHASPCWHLRRGHWRSLADGRKVWVRSCEVGSAEEGGVVKDYEVLPSEPPSELLPA
jgi:hypothetical protein